MLVVTLTLMGTAAALGRDPDGRVGEVHEVRFWDKVRALENRANCSGPLVQRIDRPRVLRSRNQWAIEPTDLA